MDTDHNSSSRLGNLFKPFESPLDFDDLGNLVNDHYHWRFLGLSCLKSDTYNYTDVSFFQVFELLPPNEHSNKPLIPTLTNSSTTATGIDEASTNTSNHDHSTYSLEPFHSKYTIVISVNTQIFKPSKRQQYYIFPCDSIVETVNEAPPFELFCSFTHGLKNTHHSNGGSSNHVNAAVSSNDQAYPPPCSSPTGTPDIKTEQSINNRAALADDLPVTHVSLSGISKELYSIIKETVAEFETTYRNMMQLMKLHAEGVANWHSELLVVGRTNGTSKKSSSDMKSGRNKCKGSRHQSPPPKSSSTNTAASFKNSKAAPISSETFESITMAPKSLSVSPPSPSRVVTTATSSDLTPLTTLSSPTLSTTSNSQLQRQNVTNGRKCIYCSATKTPMWRRGPEGAGTLCNACGVKWKNRRILCGKPSELGSGSSSAPTPGSSKSTAAAINIPTTKVQQKKKRKQHDEPKASKDKRMKMTKQQQQHRQPNTIDGTSNEAFSNLDNTHDEDDDTEKDDDGIMKVGEQIPMSRHLSIDNGQQYHRNTVSYYHLPPRAPHSRPRSMTTSTVTTSLAYQPHQHQQQEQHQHQHQEHLLLPQPQHQLQHQQQMQRSRRHTTDVSIFDRAPWAEYRLSMGVDVVEAATVLSLLRRS